MMLGHAPELMRYDRIMLRSAPPSTGFFGKLLGNAQPNQKWECTSIDMLGTKKFKEQRGIPVFISDHFGLIAAFTFK